MPSIQYVSSLETFCVLQCQKTCWVVFLMVLESLLIRDQLYWLRISWTFKVNDFEMLCFLVLQLHSDFHAVFVNIISSDES